MRVEVETEDGPVQVSRVLMRLGGAIDDYQYKWGSLPIAFAMSFENYIWLFKELGAVVARRSSDGPPTILGVPVHTSADIPNQYVEVL